MRRCDAAGLLLLAVAVGAGGCARMPGPAKREGLFATRPLTGLGADLSADSCAGCHEREHAQWRESGHGGAYSNPLFAASFVREPRAWCVNCHAPLREQYEAHLKRPAGAWTAPGLLAEGINCAVCHLRGGEVLSSRPPTAAASAAHPMRVDARLAQSELCADCHQFDFPDGHGVPMQNTVREWQASPAGRAGKQCQSCHSDHRFGGGHDVAAVRAAIKITADRELTLKLEGVGHRFPTGDPFRRLSLQQCDGDECTQTAFQRRFQLGDSAVLGVLREGALDPVRPTQVPLAPGASRWRLVYRYAAPGTELDLSGDEVEQEIASGQIEPRLSRSGTR